MRSTYILQTRKNTVRGRRNVSYKISPIPNETIEEIVAIVLARHQHFSEIIGLSCASHVLRQIALKRFFSTFAPISRTHWTRCCQIPGIFSWVRTLKCTTSILTTQPNLLVKFIILKTVELDFSPDGLATQAQRAKLLLPLLPATLAELRLISLPRIDAHILGVISTHCPVLETLDITCVERLDEDCCWLCLEDSSTCIVHSPIPDVYPNVEGLAMEFATALRPLKHLHHIFLGICLSDSDVFDVHFQHRFEINMQHTSHGPVTPADCVLCQEKHVALVRERELVASALVARSLPSLQTISWSTWFAQDEQGDDTLDRLTTIWIRRRDGMIHVRRAPW